MKVTLLKSEPLLPRFALLNRRSIWLFAIAISLLSQSLFAQNPLRAQAGTQNHNAMQNTNALGNETPQTHLSAVPARDPVTGFDNMGAIERITRKADSEQWTSNTRYDETVQRAGFNAPMNIERRSAQRPTVKQSLLQPQPQVQLATEATRRSDSGPNFIERENGVTISNESETTPAPKQENLGQLISKLGMNLAFVLFLAIGGILVAKQWIKPQSVRRAAPKDTDANPLSMQIVETLRIDAKTTLHLVECGTSSVLVATDAAGIKSVNLLSPSFDRALLDDAVSQEQVRESEQGATPRRASQINRTYRSEPNKTKSHVASPSTSDGMDDKLIRMLLESSKKHKVAG